MDSTRFMMPLSSRSMLISTVLECLRSTILFHRKSETSNQNTHIFLLFDELKITKIQSLEVSSL